ncbi:hypothetical protein [Spirosoma gilvum]
MYLFTQWFVEKASLHPSPPFRFMVGSYYEVSALSLDQHFLILPA